MDADRLDVPVLSVIRPEHAVHGDGRPCADVHPDAFGLPLLPEDHPARHHNPDDEVAAKKSTSLCSMAARIPSLLLRWAL